MLNCVATQDFGCYYNLYGLFRREESCVLGMGVVILFYCNDVFLKKSFFGESFMGFLFVFIAEAVYSMVRQGLGRHWLLVHLLMNVAKVTGE